jgi:hypothetical protein
VETELFHADRQTDVMKQIVTFRNAAQVINNLRRNISLRIFFKLFKSILCGVHASSCSSSLICSSLFCTAKSANYNRIIIKCFPVFCYFFFLFQIILLKTLSLKALQFVLFPKADWPSSASYKTKQNRKERKLKSLFHCVSCSKEPSFPVTASNIL